MSGLEPIPVEKFNLIISLIRKYHPAQPATQQVIKTPQGSRLQILSAKPRKKYTLREIAQEAQVSTTTVFRIVHGLRTRTDAGLIAYANRQLAERKANQNKQIAREHRQLIKYREKHPLKGILPSRAPGPIPLDEKFTEEELRERFLSHVIKKEDQDCWDWDRSDPHYYWQRKSRKVHLIAAEIAGLTQEGQSVYVRHTCKNKRCCNPAHLRIQPIKSSGRITLRRRIKQTELEEIRKYYEKVGPGATTDKAVCERYNLHPEFLRRVLILPQRLRRKHKRIKKYDELQTELNKADLALYSDKRKALTAEELERIRIERIKNKWSKK